MLLLKSNHDPLRTSCTVVRPSGLLIFQTLSNIQSVATFGLVHSL